MKFDGKGFAQEIEEKVTAEVRRLAHKPKVVSVIVGNDPASELYTRLKQKAAERVGVNFSIEKLEAGIKIQDLREKIILIGNDKSIDGVMIQLPVPQISREDQKELLKYIPIEKDIDGLRWEESHVMLATVRAILSVLERIAEDRIKMIGARIVVVGSNGSIGKPLMYFLKKEGYKYVDGFDIDEPDPTRIILEGDIVISCVGKSGIVTQIKPGAIAIDVGISMQDGKVAGDMTQDVYNAASVSVEVPGGIGPVTIACLMQNIYDVHARSGDLR